MASSSSRTPSGRVSANSVRRKRSARSVGGRYSLLGVCPARGSGVCVASPHRPSSTGMRLGWPPSWFTASAVRVSGFLAYLFAARLHFAVGEMRFARSLPAVSFYAADCALVRCRERTQRWSCGRSSGPVRCCQGTNLCRAVHRRLFCLTSCPYLLRWAPAVLLLGLRELSEQTATRQSKGVQADRPPARQIGRVRQSATICRAATFLRPPRRPTSASSWLYIASQLGLSSLRDAFNTAGRRL